MHNMVYLIGRLTDNLKLEEREDGGKYVKCVLAVQRSFKNEEGIYETDFIDVVLFQSIAQNAVEYCQKGDLIGLKGRIETKITDGKKEMYIIADKISFLASKKADEEVGE